MRGRRPGIRFATFIGMTPGQPRKDDLRKLKDGLAQGILRPRRRLTIPTGALTDKESLAAHLRSIVVRKFYEIRLTAEQVARIDRQRESSRCRRRTWELYCSAVSLAAHAVAILIASLLYIGRARESRDVPVFISMAPEWVEVDDRGDTSLPGEEAVEIEPVPELIPPEVVAESDPPVVTAFEDRVEAPPEIDFAPAPLPGIASGTTPDAPPVLGVEGSPEPPSGQSSFSARGESASRGQAVLSGGGNRESENAVSQGLAWLAKHQDRDGSWAPCAFTAHCPRREGCAGAGVSGAEGHREGVSGLALLAFLGRGCTHRTGTYCDVVRRGADYLVSIQGENGVFDASIANYGEPSRGEMYGQGICTLALAELYGMSHDGRYGAAARKGLEVIVRSQQSGGGWDYEPDRQTGRDDLSVTGWQVMAMKSCLAAGIDVAAEPLLRTISYLDRSTRSDGWMLYADREPGARTISCGVTGAGLASKLFLGWNPQADEVLRSSEVLLGCPPDWEATARNAAQHGGDRNMYYSWYYATLALYQRGGESWSRWNPLVRDMLVARQRTDGHTRGSWDPIGIDAAYAGRVYATAMSVLTLEVYYRYLPVYRNEGNLDALLGAVSAAPPAAQMRAEPALRLLGGEAMARFAAVLERNPDPAARTRLAEIRLASGDAGAARDLEVLLAPTVEPAVRLRAARALHRAGGDAGKARAVILELARDANPVIRFGAAQAIAESRDREGIAALASLLVDSEDYIRIEAGRSLAAITGEGFERGPADWLDWWRRSGQEARAEAERGPARSTPHPVAIAAVLDEADRRLGESIRKALETDGDDLPFVEMLLQVEEGASPGADVAALEAEVARLGDEVRASIGSGRPGSEEIASALQAVLFGEGAFRDVRGQPGVPPVLLGEVLRERGGNCVGLSALAACVAERSGVRVYGCRFPGHFFLEIPGERGEARYFESTARGQAMTREAYERIWEPNEISRHASPYFRRVGERALLAEILNLRAQRRRDAGDLDGALRDITWAVALDGEWPVHRTNRAGLLLRMERIEEAVVDYTQSIRLDAGYAPAYVGRAALHLRRADAKAALADLVLAFRYGKPQPDGYLTRAAARQMRGEWQSALDDYARAIEAGAGAEAYLLRGVLQFERGRRGEAERDLREALARSPGNVQAMYHLARLLVAVGTPEAGAEAHRILAAIRRVEPAHAGAGLLEGLLDEAERGGGPGGE